MKGAQPRVMRRGSLFYLREKNQFVYVLRSVRVSTSGHRRDDAKATSAEDDAVGYWNPVESGLAGTFDEVAGLIGNRRYALVTYDQPDFQRTGGAPGESGRRPVARHRQHEINPDSPTSCIPAALSVPRHDRPKSSSRSAAGSMMDAAEVLAASKGDFATSGVT